MVGGFLYTLLITKTWRTVTEKKIGGFVMWVGFGRRNGWNIRGEGLRNFHHAFRYLPRKDGNNKLVEKRSVGISRSLFGRTGIRGKKGYRELVYLYYILDTTNTTTTRKIPPTQRKRID